jgi:hypothetical protein
MPIYRIKVPLANKDLFFEKLKEIYSDKDIIRSFYAYHSGDPFCSYDLELEGEEDLTMLKLCLQIKQIPSAKDRKEIMEKIVKGLI